MSLDDLERRAYGRGTDWAGAPCEHCGYMTRAGWAERWRVACRGCHSTHLLCVDCGVALGETRHNWPVWAEMETCPDDAAMLRVLTGQDPATAGGIAETQAVLRENRWGGKDTIVKLRKRGIPVQRVIPPESPADGTEPGVLLQDGREVYAEVDR